jgi:hypothetical protein
MEESGNMNELQRQFADILEKAKKEYPKIEDSIDFMNNMTAQTKDINDFLNLTYQTSAETSTNQITFLHANLGLHTH